MHGLDLVQTKVWCGRSGKELDAVGVLRDELLLLGEIVRRLIDACASVRVVVENLYDGTRPVVIDYLITGQRPTKSTSTTSA